MVRRKAPGSRPGLALPPECSWFIPIDGPTIGLSRIDREFRVEHQPSKAGGRGKDGKDQRSFAFAQAFGRGVDSAQPCCLSERQRIDANACTKSTSWGSLVRAQYRPFGKGPPARA